MHRRPGTFNRCGFWFVKRLKMKSGSSGQQEPLNFVESPPVISPVIYHLISSRKTNLPAGGKLESLVWHQPLSKLPTDRPIPVVDAANVLGEGPVWCSRKQELWWVGEFYCCSFIWLWWLMLPVLLLLPLLFFLPYCLLETMLRGRRHSSQIWCVIYTASGLTHYKYLGRIDWMLPYLTFSTHTYPHCAHLRRSPTLLTVSSTREQAMREANIEPHKQRHTGNNLMKGKRAARERYKSDILSLLFSIQPFSWNPICFYILNSIQNSKRSP